MRFATKALRVGQNPDPEWGAVITPIYQSSTFFWKDLDTPPPIDYTRVNNPNRKAFEQVLAALENGEYCVAFASGMAAIQAAFSFLRPGDHLLMASDIYGGTHRLFEQYLPAMGIEGSEFDAARPESILEAVRPNSRMLIFETPTNPTLRVMDIHAITDMAQAHGLLVVMDNTFASPYLQNPLDYGVDMVVHSTTKYIAGHSDLVGGALVTNDQNVYEAVFEYQKAVGAIPSPFDCWLTVRGLKTLEVRMQKHCSNAQTLAEYLAQHPKVSAVHYPGLKDHPEHELAKRQMRGFGGMLSFELRDGVEAAKRVAKSFKVFLLAESLGGVESLIAYPPKMSHAGMTEEQRLERGIPPNLLRVSVGIEDPDDLIEDMARALEQA